MSFPHKLNISTSGTFLFWTRHVSYPEARLDLRRLTVILVITGLGGPLVAALMCRRT
jgi:hypothetical protein